MSGDESARAFDRLLADFLEAAAQRKSLGLPLPRGGRSGDALAPWFASKEGRARVKKTLAALKDERRALRALAKFSRKTLKDNDKPKSGASPEKNGSSEPVSSRTGMDTGASAKAPAATARPSVATSPAAAKPRVARSKRASPSASPTRRTAAGRSKRSTSEP
ncbi:MAG: hypothetical protein O9972_11995 [Burkholderiales bacterium]|jgi:hypothetical protein|nr:hypothetical protein [Burkholderiales bacterium]